jgi:hypothetical protein
MSVGVGEKKALAGPFVVGVIMSRVASSLWLWSRQYIVCRQYVSVK